jgi:hypothetical protein
VTEREVGSLSLASTTLTETVFHEDSVWRSVESGEPVLDGSNDRAVFSWEWTRAVKSRENPMIAFTVHVRSCVEVIVMPASIVFRYSEAKIKPSHDRSVGAERQISRHILGATSSRELPMTILRGEWETLEQIVAEAMEKIVRDIHEPA